MRLVGLTHRVCVSEVDWVREHNKVQFQVVVVGVVEDELPRYFLPFTESQGETSVGDMSAQLRLCREAPFVPIEGGASLELLRRIAEEEPSRAVRNAFAKIEAWSRQCAERVVADLYAFAILNLQSPAQPTIYFILGPVTTKIAGRLGYLYLPPEVTVAILYTEPGDLMTAILAEDTGVFNFDLWYFREREARGVDDTSEGEKLGPYPGNLEKDMLQTYFIRPRKSGPRSPLPVRVDILAQGITDTELAQKKRAVEKILYEQVRARAVPTRNTKPEETMILPNCLEAARVAAEVFVRELLA